jgi:hypothetical protein
MFVQQCLRKHSPSWCEKSPTIQQALLTVGIFLSQILKALLLQNILG